MAPVKKVVKESARALLSNIVDYAGVFPPAKLPFADALKVAATFRSTSAHPWLMGRIVQPIAELKNLTPKLLAEAGADGYPWIYTVLSSEIKSDIDLTETCRVVEWDLREIRNFNEKYFESSIPQFVASYEMKLPASWFADPDPEAWSKKIHTLAQRALKIDVPLTFFLEIESANPTLVREVAQSITRWLDEQESTRLQFGLKIRMAGARIPGAAEVAAFVSTCLSHGLKFKATQGLHHALSQGTAYGFVNLFAILALSKALGIEQFGIAQQEACLLDGDSRNFTFTDDTFSWRQFSVSVNQIESARRMHGGRFGSCSVQEPDEFIGAELKENL